MCVCMCVCGCVCVYVFERQREEKEAAKTIWSFLWNIERRSEHCWTSSCEWENWSFSVLTFFHFNFNLFFYNMRSKLTGEKLKCTNHNSNPRIFLNMDMLKLLKSKNSVLIFYEGFYTTIIYSRNLTFVSFKCNMWENVNSG